MGWKSSVPTIDGEPATDSYGIAVALLGWFAAHRQGQPVPDAIAVLLDGLDPDSNLAFQLHTIADGLDGLLLADGRPASDAILEGPFPLLDAIQRQLVALIAGRLQPEEAWPPIARLDPESRVAAASYVHEMVVRARWRKMGSALRQSFGTRWPRQGRADGSEA